MEPKMTKEEKYKMCSIPQTIDDAIEKAAQHLPLGYVVNIEIERNGYNIELEKPDSTTQNIDGGDGICSDITEAICVANGFSS